MNFYNYNLAERFVSDYKLPIGVFTKSEFEYSLNLYEATYQAMSKWNALCENIYEIYAEKSQT